jgi:endo-1,4-beta-xylanase
MHSAGMVLALLGAMVASAYSQTTLKEAYKDDFLIGAAVNRAQVDGKDKLGISIVKEQFNSITPENVLKWENVHPKPDAYNFGPADQYVEFGEKNHMFIVGHTLVWHSQTPKWVFQDDKGNPVDRATLLKRMEDHITTVVGRYKGRVNGWDVVNEVVGDDGTLRQSPWMKIIGEDYIEKAFEFAHKADPKAQLYYNDYSLENDKKRKCAIELVKKLLAKGVPISGVGNQAHISLEWPTAEQEDAMISDFGKLGVKVHITELDMDVLPQAIQGNSADVSLNAENQPRLDPYKEGLPKAVQDQQAKLYADMFKVWLKHRDVVARVTFWGVTDGDSWKNNWPVRGRTNYPLLFDREGKPKPAFDAVIKVATQKDVASK